MITHPNLLLKLVDLQHQEQRREVETWRLAMTARQGRAKFLGSLLHRLVMVAKQQLRGQARPGSATPNLANFP